MNPETIIILVDGGADADGGGELETGAHYERQTARRQEGGKHFPAKHF